MFTLLGMLKHVIYSRYDVDEYVQILYKVTKSAGRTKNGLAHRACVVDTHILQLIGHVQVHAVAQNLGTNGWGTLSYGEQLFDDPELDAGGRIIVHDLFFCSKTGGHSKGGVGWAVRRILRGDIET